MPHQPPPPPVRRLKTKSRASVKRVSKPKKRVFRGVSTTRKRKQPVRRELSAGGVAVRMERGGWFVALLKTEHRKGEVWVLPKGHVELEKKERISDAAKREVQEETGLKDLSVKDQLGVARFSFQAEGTLVRKTVHYYMMITQQKTLVPQEEEFFLEAGWFPIDVAIQMLEYDTDKDVVAKAREKLTGKKTPVRLDTGVRRGRGVRVHA